MAGQLTDEQKQVVEDIKEKALEILAEGSVQAEEVAVELRARGLEVPASLGEVIYDLVTQQALTSAHAIQRLQESQAPVLPALIQMLRAVPGGGGDDSGQLGRRRLITVPDDGTFITAPGPRWLSVRVRNLSARDVRLSATFHPSVVREEGGVPVVKADPNDMLNGGLDVGPGVEVVVRQLVSLNDAPAGPGSEQVEIQVELQKLDDDGDPVLVDGQPVLLGTIIQPFEILLDLPLP